MTLPSWLAAPADRLADALKQGRFPHAVLLQGPGGWGESLLASWLALKILDVATDQHARDLAHPDLRWIEPDEGSVKIEQIRSMSAFVAQTARRDEGKVVVVDEAHSMNQNAANALLKTLEEPPPGSYLILVTDTPARLLPTIRSRCQKLQIVGAPEADVRGWLEARGVRHDELDMLLVEHGGAPFAVEEAIERGDRSLWGPLSSVRTGALSATDAADALRNEVLPDLLGKWLRHVHRLAVGGEGLRRGLLDFADELTRLRAMSLVNTGLAKQVQLERLFVHWCGLDLPSMDPAA